VRRLLAESRNDGAGRAAAESGEVTMRIAERVARWFTPKKTSSLAQYPSQPIDYLPVWKRGATPGERLREVALIADKHPERFEKMVIVYTQNTEKGIYTRMAFGDATRTSDALGLLAMGQHRLWHDTHPE
jgi:hypothetical protein